jgi:hypothetical protein
LVRGRVADQNGTPIPNAIVSLTEPSGIGIPPIQHRDIRTGEDGSFEFRCVKHDAGNVNVDASVAVAGGPLGVADTLSVMVPPDGINDLLVTIRLGIPLPSITGIVTDAGTGQAINNVQVSLLRLPYPYDITRAEGRYTLSPVPTGNQTVKANDLDNPPRYYPGSESVIVNFNSGVITRDIQLVPITPGPRRISLELFNTGVDANRATLASGSADPHWQVEGPGISGSPQAIVVNDQNPERTYFQSPNSAWIWANAEGSGSVGEGNSYTFRLEFDVPPTVNLFSVVIRGWWGADNRGYIRLNPIPGNPNSGRPNGTSSDVYELTGVDVNHFFSEHQFTINSGFRTGRNTLVFYVTDEETPGGLHVTNLEGSAMLL